MPTSDEMFGPDPVIRAVTPRQKRPPLQARPIYAGGDLYGYQLPDQAAKDRLVVEAQQRTRQAFVEDRARQDRLNESSVARQREDALRQQEALRTASAENDRSRAASVDWWSKRDANGRLLQPAATQSFTPSTSLQSAYSSFLGTPATTTPGSQSAQVQSAPAQDMSQVNDLIQQLTQQATEGRASREQQAATMRDLLQGRIKEASAPVDVNAPALQPILAAQRLARQRSAERQRSQVAARLSREGLLDSGAFDTAMSGIEQARGEGESADIAATLAPEQQARRQELQSLLQITLSQGDNEAAREIQAQIAALGAAQGAASLGEQRRQFDTSFGEGQRRFASDDAFRRSSFLDNLRLAMAR